MISFKEPSGKADVLQRNTNENSEGFQNTAEEKCEDNPEAEAQKSNNNENQSVKDNSDVTAVPEKENRHVENYEKKEKKTRSQENKRKIQKLKRTPRKLPLRKSREKEEDPEVEFEARNQKQDGGVRK